MKQYSEMSAAELAEATKQYDGMVIDKTRRLDARERKLWSRRSGGAGGQKSALGLKK